MSESVWKWITGVAFALMISFGGYIWSGMEARSLAGEKRLVQIEITLAQEQVRNLVEYKEIERRLGNIELTQQTILRKIDEFQRLRGFSR